MILTISATENRDNLVSEVTVTGQTAAARTPAGAGSFLLDTALRSTLGPTCVLKKGCRVLSPQG
jgi:hypothetical protein